MVGGFYGMLLLSAEHSRSLVWWEQHMKGGLECLVTDQWYRLVQWSNITLWSQKTNLDCISLVHKSCQVFAFDMRNTKRGRNLERRWSQTLKNWRKWTHQNSTPEGSMCEHHTSHRHFFTVKYMRTRMAQVWVRTRSSHPCLMFLVSVVSVWSLRQPHLPLLPHHLLSDHLSFLLPVNFIFQDVVDNSPVQLRWGPWHPGRVRASHRLWAQRLPHHGSLWTLHPEILGGAAVLQWLRLRWRHHRHGAVWRMPKTSRSLWKRRLVVLSVVVNESW